MTHKNKVTGERSAGLPPPSDEGAADSAPSAFLRRPTRRPSGVEGLPSRSPSPASMATSRPRTASLQSLMLGVDAVRANGADALALLERSGPRSIVGRPQPGFPQHVFDIGDEALRADVLIALARAMGLATLLGRPRTDFTLQHAFMDAVRSMSYGRQARVLRQVVESLIDRLPGFLVAVAAHNIRVLTAHLPVDDAAQVTGALVRLLAQGACSNVLNPEERIRVVQQLQSLVNEESPLRPDLERARSTLQEGRLKGILDFEATEPLLDLLASRIAGLPIAQSASLPPSPEPPFIAGVTDLESELPASPTTALPVELARIVSCYLGGRALLNWALVNRSNWEASSERLMAGRILTRAANASTGELEAIMRPGSSAVGAGTRLSDISSDSLRAEVLSEIIHHMPWMTFARRPPPRLHDAFIEAVRTLPVPNQVDLLREAVAWFTSLLSPADVEVAFHGMCESIAHLSPEDAHRVMTAFAPRLSNVSFSLMHEDAERAMTFT